MKKEAIVITLVSVVLFPSYAFLSYAFIPIYAQTCQATSIGVFIAETAPVTDSLWTAALSSRACSVESTTLTTKVNFAVYAITLMTIAGWFMLCFFLPTGMWAYPFDNIGAWITRPMPMNQEQFSNAKAKLTVTIETLSKMGKDVLELKKNHNETSDVRFLKKLFIEKDLAKKQREFEMLCQGAEEEFNRLDSIATYSKKVEPLKFLCYLIWGIFMGILSILFIVHIFCYLVVFNQFKVSSQPFFNNMLAMMEDSVMSFAAIPIFLLMGYYFLFCAHKGNIKLGMRFLFVTFYPVKPKETYVSSFFANCIVMNLYSVAVTQFVVQCFAQYMIGTAAAKIWIVQVQHMQVWSWLFTNNFFVYWTIAWWFLTFIFFCIWPFKRIYLGGQLEKALK